MSSIDKLTRRVRVSTAEMSDIPLSQKKKKKKSSKDAARRIDRSFAGRILRESGKDSEYARRNARAIL